MNPAQVCLTQRTGNYADAQETRTGRLLCSAVVGGSLSWKRFHSGKSKQAIGVMTVL